MSHTGNSEDDFEGLNELGLPEDVVNIIKQARMFAREIIGKIEPRNIYGWDDLRVKLEHILMDLNTETKLIEVIKKIDSGVKK